MLHHPNVDSGVEWNVVGVVVAVLDSDNLRGEGEGREEVEKGGREGGSRGGREGGRRGGKEGGRRGEGEEEGRWEGREGRGLKNFWTYMSKNP